MSRGIRHSRAFPEKRTYFRTALARRYQDSSALSVNYGYRHIGLRAPYPRGGAGLIRFAVSLDLSRGAPAKLAVSLRGPNAAFNKSKHTLHARKTRRSTRSALQRRFEFPKSELFAWGNPANHDGGSDYVGGALRGISSRAFVAATALARAATQPPASLLQAVSEGIRTNGWRAIYLIASLLRQLVG